MFGNDISQVAAQAREFERSGKRDKFLEESANAVYDDGEGRQLFPVEIDPTMDRYLRQKGEGWQADAYRSWQRGKMLAADLRKGGDDPMKAEKERVLGEERAKVQEYVNERTRRGMPLFPDALAFKSAQEDEAEYARRKDKVDWHRSVFNGDLKKVPESVKKEFEAQFFPDNELGDELRARSLVLGWALDEGGYTENQVSARNGVPLLEQMAIRLKEQGEQIDFNKPGLTVYRFLSRRAQEDAHADELLKGAAESVRQAVLTGGDGRQALWEQRGQMGEDMYKKVGNTLRWVKADAERTRRGLEPVLPRVMEGLEWAVKHADGTANRIFQPEGMASIHQALKAMDGLTDAQMDALAEIVQRKGGNERSYMANVWKAGNRGWEDLGNGIRSLLRGGIAAQLDVAGGVKELFGGDGSALKADAKAADEYGRRLDAFLAMAQGTYRPINKPEYGWFGNGVLSAVRSVPITALSFSGVGAGVAAMSYAGDSYSKAVQERPDGGRLARLGGAAASGAVQGALDRAGAIVAKGVMGLRSGSAFVDKWMSKLSLSRQAMRLKSSALRAGARSGVAGGMVLGEEMTTEKLQDLADPVMQSLASVMAGEAPGIDWERFWKDFTNRDQNMELFGSVLAFALVGAGARFTAEAGMQRQLSREYGKLKRTFGFSDSLLARMRAEESDVARYAMMQDGIQDFMRRNYGQEVDGVKVGLGDRDGMRKLAARGGVRTMDVVAAAEAHAAETARGVDEVRVDGAEVQDGKGAVVDVKGPESGGVSEVGSGPVLSFEHGPVPERKGRRQADEKEAMREYVKAVNEQLKEFGASPIREEMNEFTEEMQYVVELGDRPEFYDTYDDAYEAVLRHLEEREDEVVAGLKSSLRQYRDKDEGYVGRVQDEANEEMMQHLSDVGQDGRMSFDRSKLSVPMTLAQLKTQGDFMRKSAEGRERIYAAQMGVEAGVDAARLRVYGANVAQEFANGRYEVVSRLYRGANPFDVYEEWTEGMTKVLIKDNEWTVAEFEDELKRLEGATGETFLATGEGVDRLQAVCEGVSKAARAHLMGHISDERLPDKLRRWFKMFALLFAKYFEFAQDVMLAKKMLGADVQGKMSEKFRRLLNDFAGFDEAAIAERARREEQAQIEAEAMGDVPEIGEWVAGRLPHPKTAAEAGSDLTGELQRIYDALTTTRTAKGRRRKDGTLGKSFEQRVVARAEQFFSREGRVSDVLEAANEAGFDFADSGELLSAVYDSVVYGYKRYAARGEGQEVSFSMGDRVRRVPMAEARRVADAFHRVEGMEPVAADVPAAYASDLKDALGDIRERYRVLQKETQEQGYALVMGDGKRVQVGGKGWREVKQHAADRRVLAALAVLPELAGRAEFIYSGENSDLKRKPNIARFHYYLTKADFKGASGDGSADLAYVNIAVAEGKNGELFYDLDASTVEDVDSMKGTSATLQRPRVPNTGEAGDGVPHKGRVALLKEFVNYVDRDLAGQGREGREVSVQDVEAQGGFDEHGVLAAENAVVVKPDGDVTMSVRALHASPHSFRKFDTAFMGKGEGNQAYGWGLYFATNPKVNRHYLDQFKTVLSPPTLRFRDMDSRDMNTWAKVFTDYFLADNSEWDPEIVRKEIASYFKPSHIHHFANQENLKRVSQNIVNNTNLVFPEESSRSDSVKIGLEFNQWLLDHLDEIEIRPGMSSSSNYKVELNVDDSVLLDWDRPFSEQSETVKEALAGELAQRVGCTKEVALESLLMEGRRFTGQQIYVGLCEGFARDWEKGMKKASLALRKFGIKGIRYADGYTRGKAEEEQTYNYVIFDGNDIKITAFADESTGGAWADYVDGSATFSIREKASIKKKAVADGTFMKAPNGANTNLTEDQWLSVRTEAFKNWFGDWEHDPENASKVVDENGEPRVVYHGTYGDFTVFDKARIGSATDYGLWGRGFYFTNMENTPYGNKKLALFLNFRNPFIFNDYKSAEEIGDYLNIWDGNFHEDDRFGIFRPYASGAAQIADSAQERGHDGLMVVLGKWTEYIAFEPNQIKSATDNRGTFDPKNPDITFSVRAVQNLGAVHSISPEKLMEAEKLGGMPVPSVAVTRLDQPYSWGGDNSIYLIGRPGMIDPKGGADVYSRDAWTGKMPYLVHKAVGRESREQTVADLFKMEDVYQSREDSSWLYRLRYYIALDSAGDKTSREDVERCLRDEDGKALFAWQSGYRPRPKMRNAAMKHEWMTRALRDELAAYETLSEEEYESRAGEVRQKAEAAIDEYVGGLLAELEKRKPKIAAKMRESTRKTLLNSLFLSDKQGLREVLQDARRMGKRVPDLNANRKMLARYADNHKRAYEKWVQEKLAGWFSEERYIEGTGTEATLESLTKWMLSRKGRNKERQLVFGSGKVRAAQAERLGSMDEVKAMRERLSDSAVSGAFKEKTDELLREFREVVSDVFTGGDVFGYSSSVEIQSAAMEALSKVPGNPTTGKVMTALKKVFPGGARLNKLLMREYVLEKGVDALKSLRAELEDYLEAVPQRAVGLDEWVYAVMPEELKKNREVTSLLRRHGIKPLYHDGTAEGRVRVMESLVDDPVVSFAMRMMRGGQSVWDYLAGVQGHAFEQEARLYEAMQKRLESALQANGFTRDGVYKDEQGRDDEAVRERMLAVMAVCDAVVTELPRDVRGGIRPEVVASYREEVMEKKTWRGRMNALMRMVKYVDWHIVNEGKKSRFKEFERFRKWAAASVGENRVRRGKMNAEIQKRLDMVERALELDADELETAKNTAEKVVEEKALIGGAEYDEAVEWVRALDAFGGLYERNMHGRLTADLERVQAALDALKEMYAAGRLANEAFWEDRRERIADLLDEAGKGLGREQPVSVNERTGAAKHDVGVGKGMRNLVRGFVSFENLMEDLFGEGKVTEYFAEGIRKARLEFNDVRQRRVLRYYGALYRIARPEEFLKRADRKVDGQVKLGVRRVVDGMLKDLSENRTWGIEVKMPGEFRSERVRIEEARAVAEGKMEAEQMPKWAKNQKAMDALKMALSEIPAKSRKEFVKFSWLEQGAELVEMEMSDLEAAYLLQMSAMPEYEDNLEALGFDEAAIGKVRDHIDVRALRVAEYLGEEYERGYKEYNEVYRRLFGCDMPKVQNYAPGFFVTDNAAEAVDPMESRGSGWLSVGSIKMRRKHYALPRVVSCVNAYWAHSMQMDHWASFAEIMRDMKAVLLNGELGNKIDAVHGAQARTHLTKWVKDLEFDGSQDSDGAGQAQQVVSRVLGAMAQGALSYNLKTCLKQLPAMFSSMADMSPSDAMKGFIGALANPGQLAEVWQSPTIQQRLMQGMSPEMRQALTANRMKVSMLGDAVEAGMLPIGLTDAAFTTFSGGIAYMAAKKKAMKEGLSDEVVEQRALAALDKAVRRTAQPIETEQKSPWEIHANALGRMFMMFRSDPRKQIALSYMAIAKWKRGEIGMGEAAWRFGQAWVVYGIMNQVIVEFLKWVMGQGDDEEELDLWDRWKGFAVSGAMGAFSGIFGLAEVIEFIYSKLAGEKYMKFSNTMVDHAEALWRGGEGVVRMYNGEEEEYGKVMNQLGRGLNGMGLFAAAGRPEIGAAVQVMGRIVKETKSMAGTWGHLWDNEMAKAREQQRLIQATKKEEKEERKAKMEERKELMARVKGLDYSSRMKVYQDVGLDKEERKLMENRVKMDGASEVVKAVSRVKKDKRKELVEKLKGTMSDVEYEEFVTELKEKGVKWK